MENGQTESKGVCDKHILYVSLFNVDQTYITVVITVRFV